MERTHENRLGDLGIRMLLALVLLGLSASPALAFDSTCVSCADHLECYGQTCWIAQACDGPSRFGSCDWVGTNCTNGSLCIFAFQDAIPVGPAPAILELSKVASCEPGTECGPPPILASESSPQGSARGTEASLPTGVKITS